MSKSVYNLNSQTINIENLCRYYMSKKVKNVKMKFGKIKKLVLFDKKKCIVCL